MKPEFAGRENNVVTFSISYDAEEFDAATLASYKANKDRFVVDGFRRGKAPRSIIEKRYGEGVFFEDAIDNLLNEGYAKALDELKLEPVDRPPVDFGDQKFEKGKGFTATFKVEVAPEVEIKDYKGVKIDRKVKKITAKDVQAELEARQKRNSRLVSVDRAAEKGDTVILDYEGWCEDKKFDGGTAENQSLVLGSGQFIPGFEDQLVGCKAGDEKEVKVTFPKEYHAEDLAGKDAVFKCKVHEVKFEELPEIDDEFAAEISDFDTLKELKADIKKNLEESAKNAAEYDGKNKVIEELCKANQFSIPQAMIDDEAQNMLNEMAQQMQYQGLTLDMYAKYLGKTQKDLLDEMKPDAENRVRSRLIVQAIADAEGFEASEEDIEKELADMAAQYNMEIDKLKEMFGEDNRKYLRQDIRARKAIDFVYENAAITDVEEEKPKKASKKTAKAEEAAEAPADSDK
ncbi:MAG: trigger factor [Firmicutes bacterium]|nr:trigger factor [Bacillota bacterium]